MYGPVLPLGVRPERRVQGLVVPEGVGVVQPAVVAVSKPNVVVTAGRAAGAGAAVAAVSGFFTVRRPILLPTML